LKPLRKLLNNLKPNFGGEKLEKLFPAFDAFETFLFVPNHTHKSKGTHVRDAIDLKRTMILVVLSLVPCLLFDVEYWLPTPPQL
jgi:Na+-transporting NADH:ubiquinone oxidoreductase subunit B